MTLKEMTLKTAAPDLAAKADERVDAAARKLQQFVSNARRAGGLRAKIGDALEEDPAFLRKLKPSLIAARARGASGPTAPAGGSPRAPSTPPPAPKPNKTPGRGGPSPWLVLGAAFAVGIVAAKAIDWRGHAHPHA